MFGRRSRNRASHLFLTTNYPLNAAVWVCKVSITCPEVLPQIELNPPTSTHPCIPLGSYVAECGLQFLLNSHIVLCRCEYRKRCSGKGVHGVKSLIERTKRYRQHKTKEKKHFRTWKDFIQQSKTSRKQNYIMHVSSMCLSFDFMGEFRQRLSDFSRIFVTNPFNLLLKC